MSTPRMVRNVNYIVQQGFRGSKDSMQKHRYTPCNIQLQASSSKADASFKNPILEYMPHLSFNELAKNIGKVME